jgi:GTPase
MVPVVALVGRPNVGKSTLFNKMTRSRDAIVANFSGLTRDRQYGHASFRERNYIVVDTGGITGDEEGIDALMAKQSLSAAQEADIVLFMVDGKAGLTSSDEVIATELRQMGKQVVLVVNKIDRIDADEALLDFYPLGFENIEPIAAVHNRGVTKLIESILTPLWDRIEEQQQEAPKGIKLAVVGRPNVGKSTMVNRILGEERVVVFDMPGTTRDSVYIPMERRDQLYTLIDTAGVRRRGKVKETIEKFSIIKTLQAIGDSNVTIMVFDAKEGITDQDLTIMSYVIESGRGLVMAINKWDGMSNEQKETVREMIRLKLHFVDWARLHFTSALHGTGIGELFASVNESYKSAFIEKNANHLTHLLSKAVEQHNPPMVRGRRPKLKFAHVGGSNPPRIVVHGTLSDQLPESYARYLISFFRKALKIVGTPIKLEFKAPDNPYEGQSRNLTEREQRAHRRTMRDYKSEKKSKKQKRGR